MRNTKINFKEDGSLTIENVREVRREQYSVTYSAEVNGVTIEWSGCQTWTMEQFVSNIESKNALNKSWKNVLSEDNFVSRAFGLYR